MSAPPMAKFLEATTAFLLAKSLEATTAPTLTGSRRLEAMTAHPLARLRRLQATPAPALARDLEGTPPPPAGEVPGSDYRLPAGEAHVRGIGEALPAGEVPGNDYPVVTGAGSGYQPPVNEMEVSGSADCSPAAEVEVPGSDDRPPAGEVPGSDRRPPATEVEVPGSADRSPAGELPRSADHPPAGAIEVSGSDYRTPHDVIEIDSSDEDDVSSKKRQIKTESFSRNSVQKLGEGSLARWVIYAFLYSDSLHAFELYRLRICRTHYWGYITCLFSVGGCSRRPRWLGR